MRKKKNKRAIDPVKKMMMLNSSGIKGLQNPKRGYSVPKRRKEKSVKNNLPKNHK